MNANKLIYLAAPYNHADFRVTNERMVKVYHTLAWLTKKGDIVVTPLLMHEVVTRHELPNSFKYWEYYSLTLLSKCRHMLVLELEGWDTSTGVLAEIKYAKENNIPISFIHENAYSYIG